MKKILYILTRPISTPFLPLASDVLDQISISFLLTYTASKELESSLPERCFLLEDTSVSQEKISSFPSIDYHGMLQMIFEADIVITV